MPNRYHLRATIDRLWRRSADHNPGYIRVKALNAIVRELFAPNPQARLNHHLYLTTDPYDVARHKLRELYDGPEGSPSSRFTREPAPCLLLQEEEPLEEDDDPW